MQTFGYHIIAEFSGCNPEIIADLETVKAYMLEAAIKANAQVRATAFHRFSPQGVSGVVVIAESHLSIHTWPEYGYVAIDIYTCGTTTQPWKACEYLAESFKAIHQSILRIKRGVPVTAGHYDFQIENSPRLEQFLPGLPERSVSLA